MPVRLRNCFYEIEQRAIGASLHRRRQRQVIKADLSLPAVLDESMHQGIQMKKALSAISLAATATACRAARPSHPNQG
jgi:hypothetical protein